jgi:hypothetical protein
MSKRKILLKQSLFIVFVILGVLFGVFVHLAIAWFMVRGQLRNDVFPAFATWLHGSAIQTTTDHQANRANTFLRPTDLKLNKTTATECSLDMAAGIRTSVWCSADYGGELMYATSREQMAQTLSQVEQSFKNDGWSVWEDKPTGAFLDDWTFYSLGKEIDDLSCTIQISDEAPNKLDVRLWCDTSYNFMGDPNTL